MSHEEPIVIRIRAHEGKHFSSFPYVQFVK